MNLTSPTPWSGWDGNGSRDVFADPPGLPDDGEIHLWTLRLDTDANDERSCLDWLNEEDRRRADRYEHPRARRDFILTRAWLRCLLGRYLRREARQVELVRNEHGKPRLAGTGEDRSLVFNVSHTREGAVLGFATDVALGIDVERLGQPRDWGRLSAHCLSVFERDCWLRTPAERRPLDFMKYWTAKEALAKAAGRGMALGLKRLEVREDFSAYAAVPGELGSSGRWSLLGWTTEHFCLALACGGPVRLVRFAEATVTGTR